MTIPLKILSLQTRIFFVNSKEMGMHVDSKQSTLQRVEAGKSRATDMPLQMIRNENVSQNISYKKPDLKTAKEIELAIWLYDFEPQKKSDLGFKAGERIMIEFRKDSDNWWFGSIGGRKGWFPKNYIQLKKIIKE